MRVFSPSQVEAYFRDPLFWSLEYEGRWEPRYIGRKDLAGMLGIGFAAGLAAYRRGKATGADLQTATAHALDAGKRRLLSELNASEKMGQVVYEGEHEYRESMALWLQQGIEKHIAHDPIPKDWIIRDVEASLPDHGYAKIDVGFEAPGGLVVWDDKFKVSLDARYRQKELAKYEYDWKNMHYAWAYGDYQGEPVTQYVVCITILQPKALAPIVHPVPIDPELMALFVDSAKQVWSDMEETLAGRRLPYCKFQFPDQYGRHVYTDAVTKYRLHEHLMADGYVRKEKR